MIKECEKKVNIVKIQAYMKCNSNAVNSHLQSISFLLLSLNKTLCFS